jgi:hypothetical protein
MAWRVHGDVPRFLRIATATCATAATATGARSRTTPTTAAGRGVAGTRTDF